MPTSPILLLYLLMQFMCRNLKKSNLHVSTLKHSFYLMNQFNSSKIILIYCTVLVSYTLASIRLVHFVSTSITDTFAVPLVSICVFFDFNSYCVTHGGMPLFPLLVTSRVINFLMIVHCF